MQQPFVFTQNSDCQLLLVWTINNRTIVRDYSHTNRAISTQRVGSSRHQNVQLTKIAICLYLS